MPKHSADAVLHVQCDELAAHIADIERDVILAHEALVVVSHVLFLKFDADQLRILEMMGDAQAEAAAELRLDHLRSSQDSLRSSSLTSHLHRDKCNG